MSRRAGRIAIALLAVASCAAPYVPAPTHAHRKYGSGLLTPSGGTIVGVTAGSGLTGGGVAGNVTVNVGAGSGITVSADAVSADTSYVQKRIGGSCTGTNAIQTVNDDGSVVCVAAGGGGGGGSVTSVGTGTGLTGGPITTTGTIALANTAVTAGSYTLPAITVNAQGQLTAASSYAGTSCGAGTAIQLLSAAGAASCVTVGSGTVTSIATTAPITGGTITTGGTLGLSESSNLRTNAGALDLSTAVVMPGTLAIGELTGTVDSQTLASGSVTLTPSSSATIERITCNAGGTNITAMTAATTARMLDIEDAGNSCTFMPSLTIAVPNGNAFTLQGGAGATAVYDPTSSIWRISPRSITGIQGGTSISTSGTNGLITVNLQHPTLTCSAGQHFSSVNSAGTPTCTADAPTNGITGTLTSPDLVVANGINSVTNYAGSTCAGSTVVTAISASGGLTCGLTPITGPLTSGKVPLANGPNSLTNSDIDLDNGTNVGFFTGGANGPYFDANSLNFAYSNATDSTSWIDYNGALDGILHFRTLTIGNGKEAAIATFNGSSKLVEFFGAVNIDGAPTLGNGDATKVVGALSVYNNGTIPTISGCGTGATIASESSNNAGTITLGTTPGTCIVTFSAATGYTFTNAPACTVSPGSSAMKGGLYISISSTALTINGASLGASGDKIFYTCTGEKN